MDLLLALPDSVHALVVHAALDPVPEDEDVRAGWTAFWIFVGLVLATALLLWSFVRQLRKTRRNAEKGVFDPSDPPRHGRPSGFPTREQDEQRPR